MPEEQELLDRPTEKPEDIIGHGYTLNSVTDQIANVVLNGQNAAVVVWRYLRPACRLLWPVRSDRCPALRQGRRHLGYSHSGHVGLRHHQLRVVDRYRPRRNADLRHSAAAQSAVAQLHQPVRRSHDAVCRGLRRHVPAAAHGPSLDFLLDVPVSQRHGHSAAIPQPAGVGRVRGLDIRHGLAAVLVRRTAARSRHAAR